MKTVLEDIKKNQFKNVYLFYGEERYLRFQYRDRLMKALNPDGDTMNVSRFEGKGIDVREVISLADTIPFFAEHRVILIENSGFFKGQCAQLPEYIGELPDYLVLIFVESEVDKRSRMYKAVGKAGTIVSFDVQKEAILVRWILGILKKEGKQITQSDMELFLSKTGTDMSTIDKELDKLLAYTMNRTVITSEDIEAICTNRVTNQIFSMVQAVSEQQQEKALELYYDLLALKEPPMHILYLLARQFNQLLQIKEMQDQGYGAKEIENKTGIQGFIIRKYVGCLRNYTAERLRQAVEDFTQAEEDVKTGRLGDVLSVELLIIKYSRKV